MKRPRRSTRWRAPQLVACLLLLAAAPAAQVLPIPVPPPPALTRAALRPWLAEGRKLARRGDRAAAYAHVLRAASLHPDAPEILEQLLLQAPDESARRRWAIRYAAALVTDKGVVKPTAAARAALPADDPHPLALARARAAAAAELAGFVTRLDPAAPSTPLVARWAADLGHVLLDPAPTLRRKHAPAFNQRLDPTLPPTERILRGLRSLQDQAVKRGDLAGALEIAATANGLETQARFARLSGPRPKGLDKARNRSAESMRDLRARLAERRGNHPALTALEATPLAARAAFNRRHASIGAPAEAASAGGRYRLETTCGIETLVAAAKRVDAYHLRLAAWFGTDPFANQPGRIRIVPTAAALERESAPDPWAHDFARGGVLVVRFRWGTVADLGRTLTRAVARRFDRALHPLLPAWLAAGRADWLANALAAAGDRPLPTTHADFERMFAAYLGGYTRPDALKRLIEDRNIDPREAAIGGYALWVFLGEKPQAEQLAAYVGEAGSRRGPQLGRFLAHFATGKNGAAAALAEFAARFTAFARAFDPRGPADRTAPFRSLPPPDSTALIGDTPTLPRVRDRDLPWFGAAHAQRAAAHFRRGGDHALALVAWCHALTVDPWRSDQALALAELLYAQWDRTGAWAIRNTCAVHHGRTRLQRNRAPFEGDLTSLPALAGAYRRAFHDARKRGDPAGAARLALEHNRIAVRLGLQPLAVFANENVDIVSNPRHLGARGWIAAPLVGFERREPQAPWRADAAGNLTVGRDPGRRTAPPAAGRDVLVRSRAWFTRGRHLIRARIRPLTRNTDGALVVGYTRADRRVSVAFRVRDGAGGAVSAVSLEVDAGYPRDRRLPGSLPRIHAHFPEPRATFEIRVLIDHDRIHVGVDDGAYNTYATPHGLPIEGAVGFVARHGSAYAVDFPTVENLSGTPLQPGDPSWPAGLRLEASAGEPSARLLNRPVSGLPLRPAGTVLLWCPAPAAEKDGDDADPAHVEQAVKLLTETVPPRVERITRALNTVAFREPLVVAVPAKIHADALRPLGRALAARGFSGVEIVAHAAGESKTGGSTDPSAPPQILFIDALHRLRVIEPALAGKARLSDALLQWARISAAEAADHPVRR